MGAQICIWGEKPCLLASWGRCRVDGEAEPGAGAPWGPTSLHGPQTRSPQSPFPALDEAAAAEDPAPAASGSEAPAGHDVTFASPQLAICGVGARPEHTPGPGHGPGWGKNKRRNAHIGPSLSRDRRTPAPECHAGRVALSLGPRGRTGWLLQSSSSRLMPGFHVKKSVAHDPNRGTRSSRPPIDYSAARLCRVGLQLPPQHCLPLPLWSVFGLRSARTWSRQRAAIRPGQQLHGSG